MDERKKLNNVTGSCLCGSVKFKLFGEIDGFYLCHCLRCRRSTGSAHASNIFTKPDNIEWLVTEETIRRYELPEAKRFAKQFCTNVWFWSAVCEQRRDEAGHSRRELN